MSTVPTKRVGPQLSSPQLRSSCLPPCAAVDAHIIAGALRVSAIRYSIVYEICVECLPITPFTLR